MTIVKLFQETYCTVGITRGWSLAFLVNTHAKVFVNTHAKVVCKSVCEHPRKSVHTSKETREEGEMVKFQVVLTPPPQNVYHANSDVTGYVQLVTDEAKSGYKSIEITLKGYATVCWSEEHGSGENTYTVTYSSREDYFDQTAVLWSKETAPGHQLAPGSYQFQFSLRFPGNSSDLPPPFQGSVG